MAGDKIYNFGTITVYLIDGSIYVMTDGAYIDGKDYLYMFKRDGSKTTTFYKDKVIGFETRKR